MTAEPRSRTLEAMAAIHRNAEELLCLLQQEREAIAARDLDALDHTVVRKTEAAQRLADARAELYRIGNTSDPVRIHSWLDRQDKALPGLAELRARAEEALTRCEEANTVNGRLIAMGRLQAESALDVIAGTMTRHEMTTYAPDGARHRGPRSQVLESA